MTRAIATVVAALALALPAAAAAQQDAPPPTDLWNEYPLDEERQGRQGGNSDAQSGGGAQGQQGGGRDAGAGAEAPARASSGGGDDSGGSGLLIALLVAAGAAAVGLGAWVLRGRRAKPAPGKPKAPKQKAAPPSERPKRPPREEQPVGGNMVPEGYVRPPPGRLATEMPEPEPKPERHPAPALRARPSRRAIGYTSGPPADDEDDSRVRSEGATIEAACRRLGLEFGELVQDRQVGPDTSPSRPGLAYALEKISAGEASCLIVSGLDRLALSAADLGSLIESLSERGARLVVADIDLDTATRDGRLAAWALMTVGGLERTREGERRALGAAGRPKRRTPAKAKARDVPALKKRIAKMRSDGMTLQAIADTLNEEGIPTLRGGARWRPSSVQAAVGLQAAEPQGPQQGAQRARARPRTGRARSRAATAPPSPPRRRTPEPSSRPPALRRRSVA